MLTRIYPPPSLFLSSSFSPFLPGRSYHVVSARTRSHLDPEMVNGTSRGLREVSPSVPSSGTSLDAHAPSLFLLRFLGCARTRSGGTVPPTPAIFRFLSRSRCQQRAYRTSTGMWPTVYIKISIRAPRSKVLRTRFRSAELSALCSPISLLPILVPIENR